MPHVQFLMPWPSRLLKFGWGFFVLVALTSYTVRYVEPRMTHAPISHGGGDAHSHVVLTPSPRPLVMYANAPTCPLPRQRPHEHANKQSPTLSFAQLQSAHARTAHTSAPLFDAPAEADAEPARE